MGKLNLCDKCLQRKTEYVGFNCKEGDEGNPWDCLRPTCEQDEKDLLALINPCEEIPLPSEDKSYDYDIYFGGKKLKFTPTMKIKVKGGGWKTASTPNSPKIRLGPAGAVVKLGYDTCQRKWFKRYK